MFEDFTSDQASEQEPSYYDTQEFKEEMIEEGRDAEQAEREE